MPSAIGSNLDQSKTLSSGNGLRPLFTEHGSFMVLSLLILLLFLIYLFIFIYLIYLIFIPFYSIGNDNNQYDLLTVILFKLLMTNSMFRRTNYPRGEQYPDTEILQAYFYSHFEDSL